MSFSKYGHRYWSILPTSSGYMASSPLPTMMKFTHWRASWKVRAGCSGTRSQIAGDLFELALPGRRPPRSQPVRGPARHTGASSAIIASQTMMAACQK